MANKIFAIVTLIIVYLLCLIKYFFVGFGDDVGSDNLFYNITCFLLFITLFFISKGYDFGSKMIFTPLGVISLLYFVYYVLTYNALAYTKFREVAYFWSVLSFCFVLFSFLISTFFLKWRIYNFKQSSETNLENVVLVTWIVGVIATVLSVLTGNFFGQYSVSNKLLSPILGVLTQLRFLGFAAIAAVYYSQQKRENKYALLLCFAFFIEISMAFLTTSKQLIVFPFLYILIAKEYFSDGVSYKAMITSAITVFFLFLVTYAAREIWYTYLTGSDVTFTSVTSLFMAIPEAVMALDIDDVVTLVEKIQERFSGLNAISKIAEQGAPMNYDGYHGLFYFMSVLVPRIIWPSKPDTNYQIMFGQEFYGFSHDYRVLMPPSQIGVVVLDYGLIGLIVFSSVLGLICAFMTLWIKRIANSSVFLPVPYMLFVYLMLQLSKIEAHPSEILSYVIKGFPAIAFIIFILSRKIRLR